MHEYDAIAIKRNRLPRWDFTRKTISKLSITSLAEIVQKNLDAFCPVFYHWITKKKLPLRTRTKKLESEAEGVRQRLLSAINRLEDGWYAKNPNIGRFDFVGLHVLVTSNMDERSVELLDFQILKSSGLAFYALGFDA